MYNIVVFDDDIKQCKIIKKMIEKCDITVRQILTVVSREELGQMLDYGYRIDILVYETVYFLKKPVEPVRLNEALKEAVKQIEEYNNKAIMIQNGSIFTKIRTQFWKMI